MRIAEERRQPVYNLKVEGEAEYYANGILVHNCDALRYLVSAVDLKRVFKIGGPSPQAPAAPFTPQKPFGSRFVRF